MNNAAVLRMRFPGMTESIGPMCDSSANPWGASRFPIGPLPGSGARREDRARLIVHDEFRPAIPRRVARQQGPLLFHRQIQLKSIAVLNGIIYHRTVNCLLTFCLTHRSNPTEVRGMPVIAVPRLALYKRCLHHCTHKGSDHEKMQAGMRLTALLCCYRLS